MFKWIKSHRGWVIGGAAIIALASVAVWWFAIRPQAASATETPTTRTVTASKQTIEKTVSTTGTITPAVNETVAFAAAGTIQSVDVTVGDTVTKGQRLATIDTLQLKVAKAQAKSDLETAKALLANAQDNADGTDTSDAQIASYKAQVEATKATYDEAVAAMSDATLTAPVAGQVISVSYEVGDQVTAAGGNGGSGGAGDGGNDATGIVIVGTDSWLVTGTIDASSYANVKAKLQAEITMSDTSQQIFGIVQSIDLVPDTSSGVATYPYVIKVTGKPENLHDGMSADVAIVYERHTDVLAVPTLAITMNNGQASVNKVNADGSVTATPVTTGVASGEYTEITDGLAEGDSVQVAIVVQSGTGNTTRNGPMPGQMPGGMTFEYRDSQGSTGTGGNLPPMGGVQNGG